MKKTFSSLAMTFDVLIVEDEPISRRALCTLMSSRGYQTDSASSAEAALQCVQQHGMPKVALVDFNLPGMSGMEFIKRLEAMNPSVFPILITAAADDVVSRLRRQHPVAYLQKPLNFDLLMSLLSDRKQVN